MTLQLQRRSSSSVRAKALVAKTKDFVGSMVKAFKPSDIKVSFFSLRSSFQLERTSNSFFPCSRLLNSDPVTLHDVLLRDTTYSSRRTRARTRTRVRIFLSIATVHAEIHLHESTQRFNWFNSTRVHLLPPNLSNRCYRGAGHRVLGGGSGDYFANCLQPGGRGFALDSGSTWARR